MGKKKKILLVVVFLVFLLLFFLPTIAKNYIVKNSKELIGRQVSINQIKYNYFTSTIKVFDFKMFEQNDKDVFNSFDTLVINLEPLKLISNTKAFDQFYLKGLMVKTVMKDSTFNFDDLLAYHTSNPDTLKEEVEVEEVELFKYLLSNIELKEANFIFENQDINHTTHIDDFSFFIPFIGWNQEEKSNADIKFNFKNGGYFESISNVDPVSGDFDSQINIRNLNLEPFYEYVLEYAEINKLEGLLNSNITIEGNTNEAIKAIVSGHIDINDFIMTDKSNRDILTSKRIDCNLQKIDYANSFYAIDSLNFTQPYVYFEMDSITNNLFKLFKLDQNESSSNQEHESSQATDSMSSNLYYTINHLDVNNGIMDYSDNLTGQTFNYHLSDIKINSGDIKSDATWLDIYSSMLLNNRGTLLAKLGFNPSDYNNLDLDLSIKDFLLSDINVYSKHYTGHNILVGDFFYFSKSKITNGNIESENVLKIENVDIDNTKKGLYKLPLKFALFLLKDKNGDVNLQLPVRGNLNDPEINIGKIIWTTIKNKITGTVSNPVNSIANLVNVDPKEYKELNFEFNDTIPNDSIKVKLGKLLEMEKQKVGLKITLQQYVDTDLQKEAIMFGEVGKQYYEDTNKNYLDDKKEFKKYILEKVATDSLGLEEAALKILEPKDINSLTEEYNNKLIDNMTSYLKSLDSNTNIEVKQADNNNPDNSKSTNRFEITFGMLDSLNFKN